MSTLKQNEVQSILKEEKHPWNINETFVFFVEASASHNQTHNFFKP